MAYTKQTWNNGDIITAEKLNHMEDGIYTAKDDNNFIIEVEFDVNESKYVANKSIEEINEAFTEGKGLKVKRPPNLYYNFKEHNIGMTGNVYMFTRMDVAPMFESSTQVNLTFETIYISESEDNPIKVIQKTGSVNVQ